MRGNSFDMSEFVTKEQKRKSELQELKEYLKHCQDEIVKNHEYWKDRRVRGAKRVEKYQKMYCGRRSY